MTRVRLDDQIIHVAQGFHPMHIEYEKDVHNRLDLEQVLRGLLGSLYEPCEDWRILRRQQYEGEIDEAAITAPHESNRIELLPDSIRFELVLKIKVRMDSN